MKNMLDLERKAHACMRCKQTSPDLREIILYPPVYSFGDPKSKEIIVVGLNPSRKEYDNNFLLNSPDIVERRKFQLTYFERLEYKYFKKIEGFFEGKVKKKICWVNSPWEKVGYLDLVKCPTTPLKGGQWSKVPKKWRKELIKNCEGYLKEQLKLYKSKIILPYGVDVCKWFAKYLNLEYKKFEAKRAQLNNREVCLLFIPQRQGPYSKPEISRVKERILKMLTHKG